MGPDTVPRVVHLYHGKPPRLCCPVGVAVPIPNRLQGAKAARKRRCILLQHIFWRYLRAADGLHIILRLQGF